MKIIINKGKICQTTLSNLSYFESWPKNFIKIQKLLGKNGKNPNILISSTKRKLLNFVLYSSRTTTTTTTTPSSVPLTFV